MSTAGTPWAGAMPVCLCGHLNAQLLFFFYYLFAISPGEQHTAG